MSMFLRGRTIQPPQDPPPSPRLVAGAAAAATTTTMGVGDTADRSVETHGGAGSGVELDGCEESGRASGPGGGTEFEYCSPSAGGSARASATSRSTRDPLSWTWIAVDEVVGDVVEVVGGRRAARLIVGLIVLVLVVLALLVVLLSLIYSVVPPS